jgi:hypothetical protein
LHEEMATADMVQRVPDPADVHVRMDVRRLCVQANRAARESIDVDMNTCIVYHPYMTTQDRSDMALALLVGLVCVLLAALPVAIAVELW